MFSSAVTSPHSRHLLGWGGGSRSIDGSVKECQECIQHVWKLGVTAAPPYATSVVSYSPTCVVGLRSGAAVGAWFLWCSFSVLSGDDSRLTCLPAMAPGSEALPWSWWLTFSCCSRLCRLEPLYSSQFCVLCRKTTDCVFKTVLWLWNRFIILDLDTSNRWFRSTNQGPAGDDLDDLRHGDEAALFLSESPLGNSL